MEIQFSPRAWAEYLWWQTQDKKTLKRINALIKDTLREPYAGIGKPEPLKDSLVGAWIRRIDEQHRLVYRIKENVCEIAQCKGHYDD